MTLPVAQIHMVVMEKKEKYRPKQNSRLIHIRLSKDLHQRLRVQVALLDTTIQDWVAELLEKTLKEQEVKRK